MRKFAVVAAVALVVICGGVALWSRLASTTRIAFVNYQALTLGRIANANDNSFISIRELASDELDRAGGFDLVLVNGMGLRLTEEQRATLLKAAQNGTPVLTTMSTNPENTVVSVDSVDAVMLTQYLAGGGRGNYRNMLRYVRRQIDGKTLFAPNAEAPAEPGASLLYYPDNGDEIGFNSVSDYEQWLRKHGKLQDGTPRIILTGHMGVADDLVAQFEQRGMAAYPVNFMQQLSGGGHADSIGASAVINMAHGRMGDDVVDFLHESGIPLFAPVNANCDYEVWSADKRGMGGGFMSQSVVMPEIDGALRPFTLFAHFKNDEGLRTVKAIPGRLEEFVETVQNHIALQHKPNRDKKIAIFYFKGPGQAALTAEGMDVVPSLYNLLSRLRQEGYRVDGMPADLPTFERLISERGKIFNDYAAGAKADFADSGAALPVSRADYDEWCAASLSRAMREQTDSLDGEFPGHAPTDREGNLALARIQFGNVALIPQPAAGLGSDDFMMVHGTDAAPPHNYVAAYLWARCGFGADALIHFGAHGSLEFTPGKQVALGSEDWSDRLVGSLPHVYVYSASNVGEAMIAKRRAYAGIVSYLTPPFMESGVRGIYRKLTDAIADYNRAAATADSLNAARKVRRATLSLGIHRELRIDSCTPFSPADIQRVESFAEELANERICGALYVMGQPYTEEHLRSTVAAMAVSDPEHYRDALLRSPQSELDAVVNALNGGYVSPSSGGDPVLNPQVLPTGRNLYAVNAEATPSAAAWEKGKALAEETIAMYRSQHHDSIPHKVSYTLWSSEFIETEGATVAQVLYMLGVEPLRDPFGRISDLRLIPSAELGRPRIDVAVQTSGQLRDIAASRLFMISRAVKMAAAAADDRYPNYVADGVREAERILVDKGLSPKEARQLSAERVFGGLNGSYGSGITAMVNAGDRWQSADEIAGVYLNNMGALYGSEEQWQQMREHAFEAALAGTDVVVQPRQSNTWGALSLDHVYEFMGGMNLAVRSVTGKEPDGYLSDYRNRNRSRMQEVKEAIGIESRTTILNPTFIKEKMKGGAGDAAVIASTVANTYGWNVVKPDVIDNELWDNIYETYVEDRNNLGVKEFIRSVNPAAMQEMTAVMLETARKGMWHTSEERLSSLARLHTKLIEESGAACSGFVCDNARLREFIASKVTPDAAESYRSAVAAVRSERSENADGMIMERHDIHSPADSRIEFGNGSGTSIVIIVSAAVCALLFVAVRRRLNRKRN